MKRTREQRLKGTGWRIGTAGEFLELSDEEARVVEMKLVLGDTLRRHRLKKKLTQLQLAKRIGSSQSRVAKLEAAAPGITLDLLFRALFAAGVSSREIAREIQPPKRRSAA